MRVEIFYKTTIVSDNNNHQYSEIPILRLYTVFNYAQYTPLTPTRRNCFVASALALAVWTQFATIAHDDCRPIRWTIWKLA